MAENKSGGIDQQTLMYVLIGVVVALIAVVGFMLWQRSQPVAVSPAGGISAAQLGSGQTAPTTGQSAMGGSAGSAPGGVNMGTGTTAAPVDPKTATKATGNNPKDHVQQYYADVVKANWKGAYDLLPAANRSQSTVDQFGQTQAGYGIKSFKVTASTEQGNKAAVTVNMETTSYGTFSNQWTFQKIGGQWYVEGKKTMMGGQ